MSATPEEIEEDWDTEPECPPRLLPPGAEHSPLSEKEEWKQMADQDPQIGSVAADSGHGTLATPIETDLENGMETPVNYGSDIEWKEDVLIEFNDENVTVDQPLQHSPPWSRHQLQVE